VGLQVSAPPASPALRGEMKRVAIAGVLSRTGARLCRAESGLDSSGSEEIMSSSTKLYNQGGKTVLRHKTRAGIPWADRASQLMNGKNLQEDVPDVAFGNRKSSEARTPCRSSRDLTRTGEAGSRLPESWPRTVLDMLIVIDRRSGTIPLHAAGRITLFEIDSPGDTEISGGAPHILVLHRGDGDPCKTAGCS
jgi:hypothetical protein